MNSEHIVLFFCKLEIVKGDKSLTFDLENFFQKKKNLLCMIIK